MNNKLSLEVVSSQVSPQQRLLIDENTVDEINKLANDPDYGEEFLESYLTHINVLKQNIRNSHPQYLNAVKFFTLVESGNTLVDAYIKVFPSRYEDRCRNLPSSAKNKEIMNSEASRYNKSVMVNEIRRVSTIPVQLIHRNLLHEAILEQADLMRNAKSEMVRQKAGATLIAELKPAEDTQINVNVNDGSSSVIDDLRKATQALVAQERQAKSAGIPLKDIAGARIIDVTPEVEED